MRRCFQGRRWRALHGESRGLYARSDSDSSPKTFGSHDDSQANVKSALHKHSHNKRALALCATTQRAPILCLMAEPTSPISSDLDSIASLPSSSASSETMTDTEESERRRRAESDAEREWKESLQQLELLLTMVVVPYLGRYFGRKYAYYCEFSWLRVGFRCRNTVKSVNCRVITDWRASSGWARFMEWKYPVEVVMTSPKIFKAAGAVEAAASL